MFKPLILILCVISRIETTVPTINPEKTKIWGPGLKPDSINMPARYFFIHPVNEFGKDLNISLPNNYEIHLQGTSKFGACRYMLNQLDRKDGSVIVRYKLANTCKNMVIHIKYNGQHLGQSPYSVADPVHSDQCYCPQELNKWMETNECPAFEEQIESDLFPFKSVNFTNMREKILNKFNSPGSISLCNYVIQNNEIYRKCYGQYTGFKMFIDAILLSLTRKVILPDMEFFLNLGDWPLSKKGGQSRTTGPYPIFSWCGSEDSYDIILPTYDITESTLENMGRVTLDMLSVQKADKVWNEKINKAFWRGRDSRRERLDLIDLARSNPDLFNASLTNFFFFRDEEEKYGPKVAHISFLEFFEYKYQINIDGTVAAYRLPYLLAGNSLVLKQESPFYEHFYKKLIPDIHYIPFKRDLSDLVEKIEWAKQNDEKAKEIMLNAQKFTRANLLPQNIFCYHVLLFKEWSKNLISTVQVLPEMEKVEQPQHDCDCHINFKSHSKDEL